MLARTPKSNRVKLTDKLIEKLPGPGQPGFQPIWRDTEVKGFCVVVGQRSKTFTAQADAFIDGQRKSFKKTFGRHGDPGVDTASARAQAEDFRRLMRTAHGNIVLAADLNGGSTRLPHH